MRSILAFGLAVGTVAVFGSATLVSATCAYHKTQAAVSTAKSSQEAAKAPAADKTVVDQLQTAQADKAANSASQTKK